MKTKLQLVPLLALLAILAGCGTLDPTGVYKGNKVLYDADQVIATSYDILHTFVVWEYQNRKLINNPQVTAAADNIRVNAPRWFASAIALRDTYKANATSANATALQTALALLHTAVSEANTWLASNWVTTIATNSVTH